ncbi:hypothetical protein N7450_003709 [Penicillium hetheringtonii]|uniref:Nucleotidyltransferase family protein n=1 Tax=Penicillium hetheringtonii TaxID=911720 RepID=A0AAD6DPZ9_9EURO|nr:hypothetical protein N7450_003709 [Penicillium hetheringtonii]
MSTLDNLPRIAGEIARVLDDVGIPNILWGYAALGLVGQVKASSEIDFVIPDELLEKAADTLVARGFELCTARKCPANDERKRARALAAVHFDATPENDTMGPIQFFPKSHILWWLKEIPAGHPSPNDETLILTNDPGLPKRPQVRTATSPIHRNLYTGYEEFVGPSGSWTETYPIKILNPSSFTEALLLLYCRDYHNSNDHDALQLGYDEYWKRLILPMGEVKENENAIVKKNLQPEFRDAWENFNMPAQPYGWEYLHDDLRDTLRKADKLPRFPGIFRLYQ